MDTIGNVLKAANLNASAALIKAFAKTLTTKKAVDFLGSGGSSSPSEAVVKDDKKGKDTQKETKDSGKDAKGAAKNAPPPPPPAEEE